MNRFDIFIEEVLKNEGGYVNDKNDPGGETKYGISKKSFPNINIKELTKDDAKKIYKERYWNDLYDEIPNKFFAFKLFDLGINIGVKRVIKILQQTLNEYGRKDIFIEPLIVDGIFGKKTLKAVIDNANIIENRFYASIEIFYRNLVEHNIKLKKFLKGWLNRLKKFPVLKGIK